MSTDVKSMEDRKASLQVQIREAEEKLDANSSKEDRAQLKRMQEEYAEIKAFFLKAEQAAKKKAAK